MLSPKIKKILTMVGIVALVVIIIYIIYRCFCGTKKSVQIRENYENIVLQVTSGCPSGSVYNNAAQRCASDNEYIQGETGSGRPNPNSLYVQNTTDMLVELNIADTSDKFYQSVTDLNSLTEINFDTTRVAIPFDPIIEGRKITIIPIINISNLFGATTEVQNTNLNEFFKKLEVQNVLRTIISDNVSKTKLSLAILRDQLTTITFDVNSRSLIIISKWSSPTTANLVPPTTTPPPCTWDATEQKYYARRTFTIDQTNIYEVNSDSATINGNPYAGEFKIRCDDRIDCSITFDGVTGTISRDLNTPNRYNFELRFNYIINYPQNTLAPGSIGCNDPSLYGSNWSQGDEINVDLINLKSTLTKKITITYDSVPVIDDKVDSPGLQLLVKKAPANTTINSVFVNYANLFKDFYGDLSRLPILVLNAVPSTNNSNFSTTASNAVVTTNIIGRKLFGADLDMNDKTDTEPLIKTMVNRMTGIATNDITSLAIYNTYNITRTFTPTTGSTLTYLLNANMNGNDVTFRRDLVPFIRDPSTDINQALFAYIPSNGTIQHILSSKYLPGATTSGNVGNLVEKENAGVFTTNIFTLSNETLISATGNLQIGSGASALYLTADLNATNTANTSPINAIWSTNSNLQVTAVNASFVSNANQVVDTLLNSTNWKLLATPTNLPPEEIVVSGDGKALYVSSTLTGNNLVLYEGLANLATAIPTSNIVPGTLQNVYWSWKGNNVSGVSTLVNGSINTNLVSTDLLSNLRTSTFTNAGSGTPVSATIPTIYEDAGTYNYLSQFQLVPTGGGDVSILMNVGSPTFSLNIWFPGQSQKNITTFVNRFSAWGDSFTASNRTTILISTREPQNNLRYYDLRSNTAVNVTTGFLPFKTKFCNFRADWVALNRPNGTDEITQTQSALVTDTDGNLYYTPNIRGDDRVIWMKVNTPEPVWTVDFKNNYAVIVTGTHSTLPQNRKVYVTNNFPTF